VNREKLRTELFCGVPGVQPGPSWKIIIGRVRRRSGQYFGGGSHHRPESLSTRCGGGGGRAIWNCRKKGHSHLSCVPVLEKQFAELRQRVISLRGWQKARNNEMRLHANEEARGTPCEWSSCDSRAEKEATQSLTQPIIIPNPKGAKSQRPL